MAGYEGEVAQGEKSERVGQYGDVIRKGRGPSMSGTEMMLPSGRCCVSR